jgi:hypothetical protein
MTMSPMIADQTLTLTSYPCSWAVWYYSVPRDDCCGRWTHPQA